MKLQNIYVLPLWIFASAGLLWGQATYHLDDLTYYGTGPDRAAFVVDWNNGAANEVIAWGYRFDETMGYTMEQMMANIAAGSDSNLFIRWDSDAGFGAFLFGLGYQNGATAFDVAGAVDEDGNSVSADFQNGVWDINTFSGWEGPESFTGTASNAGDFYNEGWGWSSYVAGSSDDYTTSVSEQRTVSPTDWTATSLGISDVGLINEGWYAFGNERAPSTVPEPAQAVLFLAMAAFAGVLYFRRKNRECNHW